MYYGLEYTNYKSHIFNASSLMKGILSSIMLNIFEAVAGPTPAKTINSYIAYPAKLFDS